MKLRGHKKATAHSHAHTKNSNPSKKISRRRNSNSNLLINSKNYRNRSNLFPGAWYVRQQNHCRTHRTTRNRMYVDKKHCRATPSHSKPRARHTHATEKPPSSHSEPPKATVDPLRASPLRATASHATASHSKPLSSNSEPLTSHVRFSHPKSAGDWGLGVLRSRVAEVHHFHVRASFLVVRVPWSVIPFSRASTAPKTAKTLIMAHKHNLLHTHRGSQKSRTHPSRHSHCPVDCPLMWCSLVGCVAVFRTLSSTGAITTDTRGVTRRCFFDRRRGCSSLAVAAAVRRCSSTSPAVQSKTEPQDHEEGERNPCPHRRSCIPTRAGGRGFGSLAFPPLLPLPLACLKGGLHERHDAGLLHGRAALNRHRQQRHHLQVRLLPPHRLLLRQVLSQEEPKRRVVDESIIDHMKRPTAAQEHRRQALAAPNDPAVRDPSGLPAASPVSPWGGVRVLSLHLSFFTESSSCLRKDRSVGHSRCRHRDRLHTKKSHAQRQG